MTNIKLIKQLAYYGLNNLSEHNTFDPAEIFTTRINALRENFKATDDLNEVLILCEELRKLHINFLAYIHRI